MKIGIINISSFTEMILQTTSMHFVTMNFNPLHIKKLGVLLMCSCEIGILNISSFTKMLLQTTSSSLGTMHFVIPLVGEIFIRCGTKSKRASITTSSLYLLTH
ncbi:MAG: hypothetical protein ACTHK0_07960 [Ginsengibacter sp.]